MDMMKLMMSNFDVKMSEGANANDFCVSSECVNSFDHMPNRLHVRSGQVLRPERKYVPHAVL